ncbi:MAG: transposase [Longimicrobiaceae bacterium]
MLHPWLREQLGEILSALPAREGTPTEEEIRAEWQSWQEGLRLRPTLPETLPRLRLLLVLDNLTGHKSVEFVLWCFARGIALLDTPLGGSWLNMTESLQRIVTRRALEGTHPKSAEQIIVWLEAAVRGWNASPTAFVWGGRRAERRRRQRTRRMHTLGGSGACTRWRPVRRRRSTLEHWRPSCQLTH